MPGGLEIGADESGVIRAGYSSNAVDVSASQPGAISIYGALAFLHGVHFVRETSGGYAVVVGRSGDVVTDSDGRSHAIAESSVAFPLPQMDLPTALSYRQRNVTVDDDATLSTPRVFPAPGAGSLVVISHRRLFSIVGTLVDPKWRYGTMSLQGGQRSPVGADDVFYFEGLRAGRYVARVSGTAGSCVATFVVPASNAAQVNLGTLQCSSGDSVTRSPIHCIGGMWKNSASAFRRPAYCMRICENSRHAVSASRSE
jgi:hypothetical protein